MVIAGTLQAGQLIIAAVFLFGAVLTILYLFRTFNMVFLGDLTNPSAKEGSSSMIFCVALFAFLSLLGGIFVNYPNSVIQNTINQLAGSIR